MIDKLLMNKSSRYGQLLIACVGDHILATLRKPSRIEWAIALPKWGKDATRVLQAAGLEREQWVG